MGTPRSRLVLLVPALGAVLVAGACGSKTAPDQGASAPAAASVELVAAAGPRTCAVDTGRITVEVQTTDGSTAGPAQLTSNVTFDRPARRVAATVDAAGMSLQAVVDGDTAYVQFPLAEKLLGTTTPWVKFSDPAGSDPSKAWNQVLGDAGAFAGVDSCDVVAMLRGVGTVTEVGPETVDGVGTTHYSAVVDPRRAVESLPADQRSGVSAALDRYADGVTVPVEVWVDNDGIVRRLTASLDKSSLGGPVRGTGTVTFNAQLSDLGAPVDISVPPADQVSAFDPTTLSGLLGALGRGSGS